VRLATEQNLRDVLIASVSRDANRVAVRRWRDLRQMFAWAEKGQPWRKLLIDGNPAELVRIDPIVPADYDTSNVRERTLKLRAADLESFAGVPEGVTMHQGKLVFAQVMARSPSKRAR